MDRARAPRAHSSSYTIMLCALTKSSSPAAHDHFFMGGWGGGRRGIFELIIKRKAGAKGVMGRREKVKRHCTFSLSDNSPPALLVCPQLSRISQLNLGNDCGGGSL